MSVQPIKMAILAMGGEGGGVLADWIVSLGESAGYLAQTTSVPGVAQRTGATIYYVELFPKAAADEAGQAPVLALMPLPGDVDVVLASELMEAGRAVQRGLVTPDRTTLIASSHRVYSMTEKSAMGDGRVDSQQLLAHAATAAERFICFDMAEAALKAGSVISAVLFGALAGSGVLPFSREQFEATIERGGIGVKTSLAAFGRAYEAVQQDAHPAANDGSMAEARADLAFVSEAGEAAGENGESQRQTRRPAVSHLKLAPTTAGADEPTGDARRLSDDALAASEDGPLPSSAVPEIQALIARVRQQFPVAMHAVLWAGLRRLVDYQDVAYATLYLDRLDQMQHRVGAGERVLLRETARHLALWMTFEDTARVADLKTRGSRFERVRAEAKAGEHLLDIHEFMHPRLQEVCETLPASLGRWLMQPGWARTLVERFTRQGRVIHSNSIHGYLLLRAVAWAARWRLHSLRYERENAMIEAWLDLAARAAQRDPALALEIIRCQRLVKGYGDTHARGLRHYRMLFDAMRQAGERLTPAMLKGWREAALADEAGEQLKRALAASGIQGLDEAANPGEAGLPHALGERGAAARA
ncbi:MAG: indolepyruvate oxidoreductase subunit beta family protein [Lautropia sp.]|nr:indolepyruvate oxidoreductase subunit beta family protein [Lautropia sp.]